jgi:5-methylcytosine-specific restriction enzyme subunit McrC
MKILSIAETETVRFPISEFTDRQAAAIWSRYSRQIVLREPSRATGGSWELRSDGWIGIFPVVPEPGGLEIHVLPKVPMRSVFGLWDYALDLGLVSDGTSTVNVESLPDLYQRLARALANRVIRRCHMGLLKAYRTYRDSLSAMRGRLDLARHLRRVAPATIDCIHQVQTFDIEDNQIPLWALTLILNSGICDPPTVRAVGHAFDLLRRHVVQRPISALACLSRNYDRNSEDYRSIHALSRFFLESSGASQNTGDHTFVPYQIDMARLFEAGVAAWLQRHLPEGLRLDTQAHVQSGVESFRIDMVLHDAAGQALCVLDTKYKLADKTVPDDRHQIVSYAELKGCTLGVLLYPEMPRHTAPIQHGTKTVVRAGFDLHKPIDIAGQAVVQHLLRLVSPTLAPRN